MLTLLLAIAIHCYPSLVPGFPTLCTQTTYKTHTTVIVTPTPSPTPVPTPSPSPSPTPSPTSTPTVQPTSSPTAAPTPTPSASPSPTPPPYGRAVWIAGDQVLGKYGPATDGQCGTPQWNGSTVAFDLKQNGTQCGRNQFLPLDQNGNTFYLTDGDVYTWVFTFGDCSITNQPPCMGNDNGEAQSIFWQIHGKDEQDTPCSQLGFGNTPANSGSGQPQQWVFSADCSHSLSNPLWVAPYLPGEIDQFVIQAKIAQDSTGWIKMWRNGTLVAQDNNVAIYHNATASWWNPGPYKWRWMLQGGGGSQMTEVQMFLEGLTLYCQC